MRIILFGGFGFIGKNIAKYLLEKGYQVIIYDKQAVEKVPVHISFIRGEIINTSNIGKLLLKDDCVIHLAWNNVPANSWTNMNRSIFEDVIISLDLFKTCIDKGIKKIIFISSGGSVYGIPTYLPIDEQHQTLPTSAHGINKLMVEKYLYLLTKNTQTQGVILRLSNPYGLYQKPFTGQGVISTYLASILTGRKIELWGDGTAVRDYIYIKDAVKAIEKVIKYQGKKFVFNIGSGIGYSINDIVNAVEQTTEKRLKRKYCNKYLVEVGTNILNCSLAQKELNWKVDTKLNEGISIMSNLWDPVSQTFDKNSKFE